jgi:hypothetical protein
VLLCVDYLKLDLRLCCVEHQGRTLPPTCCTQVLRLLVGAHLKAGEAKTALTLVDTYLTSTGLGPASWDVWLLGIQARVALGTSTVSWTLC